MRLDRALDRFNGDKARRNCARRSRDDNFRTLCRLFLFVPHDPTVVDVTPDALRECLDTWAKRKPNTRYKVDAIFRKFCGWLVEQELLDRNPMQRIPRPVKQHPEDIDVVSLSQAGVMRMFDACETPRELICLSVLAYLGPRRGAASRLRVRDLDLENGHMRFVEKGGKVIWKPMPDELAALVDEAIGAGIIGSGPEDYVIPMARKQRRADERDDRVIYHLVKKIARRAGVEAHVHARGVRGEVPRGQPRPADRAEGAHGPSQPCERADLSTTARPSTVDGDRSTALLGSAVLGNSR